MIINEEKLKRGVSGIMRVKNDADFIKASVESCIDALDELIIVYNDCSDNSPQVIEEMRLKYPERIKVYEYKHKVYSINLTKAEYEYAKSLPNNSPHLLCNYYNFALSKVTCQYAMKIDADQIYFTDKLKKWCDAFRGKYSTNPLKVMIGSCVWVWSRIVYKINLKAGKVYPLITKHRGEGVWNCYVDFVAFFVRKIGRPVSLSGVDVFKDDQWYVTIGKKNPINNILPPYNGVGDHLIFRVGDDTYYRPDDCAFYNNLRSDSYTMIERFVHSQGNPLSIGICWYHVNAMRSNVIGKVINAKKQYPDYLVPIEKFVKLDYNKEIEPKADKQMMAHYHNVLFQFLHQYNAFEIVKFKHLLNMV